VDIRLLEGAKEDLRNAWFFYERQATGLGDRFLHAIETDVGLLPGYAGIHLQVDGFHRMLIKRFPFALYYLIDAGRCERGDAVAGPPPAVDRSQRPACAHPPPRRHNGTVGLS
jgi:hypothetical protein